MKRHFVMVDPVHRTCFFLNGAWSSMPNQSLLSWQNHLWTLGALAVYLTWRVWDEVLLNSIFFSCYYSIMISYLATMYSIFPPFISISFLSFDKLTFEWIKQLNTLHAMPFSFFSLCFSQMWTRIILFILVENSVIPNRYV